MRILSHILILVLVTTYVQSQDIREKNRQIVEDEPWILKPKEPTEEKRLREENIRWIAEVGSRHWSGNRDITSEEKNRLWSIFQNREGQEKVSALGTIVVVEDVEKWKNDLIEMLRSDERTYVHAALWVLIGKLKTGTEREIDLLTEDDTIAAQINVLEHRWAEDSNIQNRLQKYKADLEEYRLSKEPEIVEEPAVEIGSVPETVEAVEEVTPPEPTIEEPAEAKATGEPTEEPTDQSSNWWLWLIGAVLVVVGGLAVVLRRKS